MVETLFVEQLEPDDDAALASGDFLAAAGEALVAEIRRLIHGELEADRIERNDVGEHRRGAARAAGDEVAGRHAAVADAAGDRRAKLGEFEIELGLAHRGLVGGNRSGRTALGLGALVEGLLGDGAVADKLLGALEIGFGESEIGLGLRQGAVRLRHGVLERPLVDGEQQIALLDHLAVAEMDLVEIARDAGADLDRIHRDEAADIFVLVGDAALDRLGHRHGRRRRRSTALRLALAATGQHRRKQNKGGGKPRITMSVNHGDLVLPANC